MWPRVDDYDDDDEDDDDPKGGENDHKDASATSR